jgi:hypothetical protein
MSQIILDDQLFDLEVLIPIHIEYWQLGDEQLHKLNWPEM